MGKRLVTRPIVKRRRTVNEPDESYDLDFVYHLPDLTFIRAFQDPDQNIKMKLEDHLVEILGMDHPSSDAPLSGQESVDLCLQNMYVAKAGMKGLLELLGEGEEKNSEISPAGDSSAAMSPPDSPPPPKPTEPTKKPSSD